MALSRSATIVIPLVCAVLIGVTYMILGPSDGGFAPVAPNTPNTEPAPTGPTPTGPSSTGRAHTTDPDNNGTAGSGAGNADDPEAKDPEVLIPPPPIRKELTVDVGWTAPAPDAPGGADVPRVGPPPIAPLPRDKVFECSIVVETDPGVQPPVQMRVINGPPWGEALFSPEADGKTFLLRDPYGADGPRIVRFEMDLAGQKFVERFLPAGVEHTVFRIGRPATLQVKVLSPGNRTSMGAIEVDGKHQQGSGVLTIQGVNAGNSVVRVAAKGYTWLRRVLETPGGPYELMVEDAAELRLRVVRSGDGGDARKFWACAVPSRGGEGAGFYAAGRDYFREQDDEDGMLSFLNLPQGWSGTIVVWHPLYATQALPTALFRNTDRIIRPEPRPMVDVAIVDARTNNGIANAIVQTSADANTVYDAMVAKSLVFAPRDKWRQPAPYLGFPIVAREENPPGGATMRLHVDPLIESLDVLAQAPGYAPSLRRDVKVAGVRQIQFRLEPLGPEQAGTITLALPEHVASEDVTLPAIYRRFVRTDGDARTLTLERLVPGRYRLRFPGAEPALDVVEVDVGPGETKRVSLR